MASAVTRALVVGGTSGVGYGIACRVASESAPANSTIIISGRNKPANIPHSNIEFRALDASSMKAIREYATQLKAANEPKLDLLVLTQGIMTTVGRTETSEGIDRKMALHFYGRQALIRELEPVLKDDAKVLLVLDSTKGDVAKLKWEDLDLKQPGNFGVQSAADHCITMTDGMVQDWAAQQQAEGKKRHFVHAYPGLVQTNLGHQLPWYVKYPVGGLMKVLGTSAEVCGENLVRGLYEVSEKLEKEGRFWSRIDQKGHEVKGRDVWTEEQRKTVREHTWKIIDEAMGGKK